MKTPALTLTMLILAGCGGTTRSSQAPASPPPATGGAAEAGFPLAKGLTWIYQGTVVWTAGEGEAAQEQSKPLTWRMTVAEVTAHGPLVVAHLVGYFDDLAWYDPAKTQPGDWLVVAAPEGVGTRYFVARADARLLARARDAADPLRDVTVVDNFAAGLPLTAEQTICGADQPPRDDGYYCWKVEGIAPATLTVKGAQPAAGALAYALAFRTNPDHTEVTWVPGVGVTHFVWAHHGTPYGIDLTLVEVKR